MFTFNSTHTTFCVVLFSCDIFIKRMVSFYDTNWFDEHCFKEATAIGVPTFSATIFLSTVLYTEL